jgi:hypothetical protein
MFWRRLLPLSSTLKEEEEEDEKKFGKSLMLK